MTENKIIPISSGVFKARVDISPHGTPIQSAICLKRTKTKDEAIAWKFNYDQIGEKFFAKRARRAARRAAYRARQEDFLARFMKDK